MEFLCEYNFDVHYIKGNEKKVADALSGRYHKFSSSIIGTNFREHIMHHLLEDEFYEKVFLVSPLSKTS